MSSFGFGGSNFHVALEEYTGPGNRPKKLRAWSEDLLVLSAADRDSLASRIEKVRSQIEQGYSLGTLAAQGAEDFDADAHARVAVVASDANELGIKLDKAVEAIRAGSEESLPDPDVHFGFGPSKVERLAFIFPGQGSQYVGMGAEAAMTFDCARAVWDEAVDIEADSYTHLTLPTICSV